MKPLKPKLPKGNVSWYGWKPDAKDDRDIFYKPKKKFKKYPPKIDLSKGCPPIYNQGGIGSCTANAIAAGIQFELKKNDPKHNFMPSRLFIYYNERVMENDVNKDNGAEIRNGIKSVNKQGVCPEKMWKYIDDKKFYKKKPTDKCYEEALKHQLVSYHRVHKELDLMKACLAEGYPFVFGFEVFKQFEGKEIEKTGVLKMPEKKDKVLSGHAVLAVGYDDESKTFLIRNSWDTDWGKKGYFTMPYEFIMHARFTDDFWTIRMMEC